MPAPIQPGDPEQVRDLFDRIAPAYDRFNDLLSLGLHRIWKRQAVAWLAYGIHGDELSSTDAAAAVAFADPEPIDPPGKRVSCRAG